MPQRRSQTSAFTLIELILVMLILSFVVALIAPSLHGFGVGRKTSDMATLLVTMADYARTQAVAEGRTYRLTFDAQNPGFQLSAQGGSTFQPLGNENGDRVDLTDGMQMRTDVAVQPDGQHIDFHSNGRTDPAHIWFTDTVGNSIEVACESPTELFHIVPKAEMAQ